MKIIKVTHNGKTYHIRILGDNIEYFILKDKTFEKITPTAEELTVFNIEATKYNNKVHNNNIYLQLEELDKKKTRALTDFILNNDDTRLKELEAQAQELRSQLL